MEGVTCEAADPTWPLRLHRFWAGLGLCSLLSSLYIMRPRPLQDLLPPLYCYCFFLDTFSNTEYCRDRISVRRSIMRVTPADESRVFCTLSPPRAVLTGRTAGLLPAHAAQHSTLAHPLVRCPCYLSLSSFHLVLLLFLSLFMSCMWPACLWVSGCCMCRGLQQVVQEL